jgi:hypothetical protein
MIKLMEPKYSASLQKYMDRRDEAGRKELLTELNGNPSPTQQELWDAIDRLTRRYFSKPHKQKIIKPPNFKLDAPNLTPEQRQAKLRDWIRDPFNWEWVDVEGDKE